MKLARLRLDRAPGLDDGLGELRFAPGLNVVFGPNESGKSTLARTIQSTLWPTGRRSGGPALAESEWEVEGVSWSARFDGDTTWTRGGEVASGPDLPPRENAAAYRLHLRDLIAERDEEGDAFAARVRAALDGGYDLARRVTEERGRRYATKEKNELADAERELRRIEGQRADLARRADELARLEARQRAADEARGEVEGLERALEWHAARHRLAEAQRALEADPTPDLEGHEADELAGLDDAVEACESDLAAQIRARDAAHARLAEVDLPRDAPDDGVLHGWLEDARELRRLEDAREAARAALRTAVDAETRAREALHASWPSGDDTARASVLGESDAADVGAPDPTGVASSSPPLASARPAPGPGLEDVESLAQWLELRAAHAADRRALEARRAWLASDRASRAARSFDALDAEALAEARRVSSLALRAGPGLVLPVSGAVAGGLGVAVSSWRGAWAELAATWPAGAQALGLDGMSSLPPGVGEALAVGAGLVGAAFGMWVGRVASRRRSARVLGALGLEPDVVAMSAEDRLDAIQAELDARARDADRAREHAQLDADLAALERRAAELETGRRELLERSGIDPGVEDLTVVTWARRLQAHEQARAALGAATAAEASAAERLTRAWSTQVTRVAPFVAREPVTPAELASAVDGLRRRIESARQARLEVERAASEIEKLEARRAEQAGRRDALLRRLDLDRLGLDAARARLRDWMQALEARRARQARVREAAAVVEACARALDGREPLMQLEASVLEHRLARARERRDEADALREEIARLKKEVEIAEGESLVEVALARVLEARDALEARRLEVFEGVAARLLMEDVSEQIGTRHRPEVLSRATELFGLFTRHRYELEVVTFGDRGDKVRFVARATETHERKQLDELSDGTRMQLLLAARLAFVHDGEHGVRPPLVLDEALSSSDPERMTAMTDALVAEATTGRQVFYMTNDPGDVAFWERACERAGVPAPRVVRLGEGRREANAAMWAGFDPPEPQASVPAPGGLDAQAYAAKLGVPPPDPWGEPGELHLFHLLSDDLEALHRVLDQGHVERLGHFESRRRAGVAETLLGAEIVERVGFRALVAERFFEAWRSGRGRPLRPGDLDDCEALTDDFKRRLGAVAAEEGGDARALLGRIREKKDPRVLNLQKKRRAGLEAYLEEGGFLSPGEPLDEDALVARVSEQIGEALFGLARDEARSRLRDAERLVRLWTRLLAYDDDAA